MNISEEIKWADFIYQIARGDKVEGESVVLLIFRQSSWQTVRSF